MINETEKTIINNIRVVTHLRGLTISELAGKIDRTPANLSQKLAGDRSISVGQLAIIADALDVSPRDLFLPLKSLQIKEAEEILILNKWLDSQSIPIRRSMFWMGLAALNAQRRENTYNENPEERVLQVPSLF